MMNSEKVSLSVIIVNFNSGQLLSDCLGSLEKVKDEAKMDIWLVDNASSDNSIEQVAQKFPKLNLIKNRTNLGFAKANNLAAKKVSSEFVLFLNPDVKVLKGAIKETLEFLRNDKSVGAVSCQVVLGDDSLDWASHRGLPTLQASLLYFLGNDRLYHLRGQDMSKPHQVDAISGAFFMTRREILQSLGFFDEDYFMYGEDLDLCFKIKQAGYKIYFLPGIKVVHFKGISSGLKTHSQLVTTADYASRKKALDAFYQTMKIFYLKNLASRYPFFLNWLVLAVIDIKWQISKISQVV